MVKIRGLNNSEGSSNSGNTYNFFISISGNLQYTSTAGEDLAPGDFIFFKSDSKVYKATATSITGTFCIGYVTSGNLANSNVQIMAAVGIPVPLSSGLQVGRRYFLSESYGKISLNAPTNLNTCVYQVGIAKSDTEFVLLPQFLIAR